jgi:hypothetical protein
MNARARAPEGFGRLHPRPIRTHHASVQGAAPLAEPIPAVLAGGATSSTRREAGATASPWRLILLIALPYWAAVSTLLIVSSELFASGGDRAFDASALSLTLEVRIAHYLLMSVVVLLAYRIALSTGWPAERRWLAILKHAGIALAVALVSRPLFVVAAQVVLDVSVYWHGVFLPNSRGAQLWASMGLMFLLTYLFGLALLAGAQIWSALRRSELERAHLRSAWTQARLQAMRMQLNPHFLFNSFNVIATLLDAKPQPARARILLLALSDLYRRTLVASDREFMPIAEELALANDYLRIQGARFDGRLTHDIMCATDLAGMQVPALLLQPLVENAVVHGVADSRDQLRIWIHARTSDCGAGETAMLVEIGNETTGALSSSPGAGVGLRITRDRLAACYGDRARLDTRRTGPGSFDVRIRIPIPGVE